LISLGRYPCNSSSSNIKRGRFLCSLRAAVRLAPSRRFLCHPRQAELQIQTDRLVRGGSLDGVDLRSAGRTEHILFEARLYPTRLRRVRFKDSETGKSLEPLVCVRIRLARTCADQAAATMRCLPRTSSAASTF
jgi:hypothetical protein